MTSKVFFTPYHKAPADLEYNLLFCDDLALFGSQSSGFTGPEWQTLLRPHPKLQDVSAVAQQKDLPARLRILAFNYLAQKGPNISQKELLGVILEAGVDDGLETLGAFTDYSVVYINSAGESRFWNTGPALRNRLVNYFTSSAALVEQLRPSDKPRFPPPFSGMARITLLVSDGLYFGQGPANNLTKDEMSGPIIRQAKHWLASLMERGEGESRE